MMLQRLVIIALGLLFLPGCQQILANIPESASNNQLQLMETPFEPDTSCTNRFVVHELDHTTTASISVIGLYESNGSGLGINDLDNDGDLDIVLANLGGDNTILWNEGQLQFRTQRLAQGASRAVSLVDVDGDGWHDIVFTRRFEKPSLWHNSGKAEGDRFVQSVLPEVNHPFYSIDWADIDRDGDLDFVAGSYDTELRKAQGGIFDYRGGGVGVFIYARLDDGYVSQRLANQADALALAVADLNNDHWPDIIVGNDFDRPDYIWLQTPTGWVEAMPFSAVTENTMSLDLGDINNDGAPEVFATDMKPYRQDEDTLAAWQPLMEMITHPTAPDDPQIVENVLQFQDAAHNAANQYKNQGQSQAVAATGWSWSSKFGDLDNDGLLDIYVVNGMIAAELLGHLPNDELVEENQALRNTGQGYFAPMPEWGLGSTASGRGMTMADLDNDGDLDIVVNNLRSPAQLFENQLCGGAGLTVDLHWPTSQNPFAIGAELILQTDSDTYYRTVKASSGYLSGDPSRVHFGLPPAAKSAQLTIHWPDGVSSDVPVNLNTHLTIQRNN